MNTMEITKYVGAICGSLLLFLLLGFLGETLYHSELEEAAYSIEVEGGEEEAEAEPAEQVDIAAVMAEADPGAGEAIFKRCAACHKLDGNNAVGPHLDGVVERDIASIEGFSYSDALVGIEGGWTHEELYAFLENPKGYAPGTIMSFAGLSKPEDRANVIAYLEQSGG